MYRLIFIQYRIRNRKYPFGTFYRADRFGGLCPVGDLSGDLPKSRRRYLLDNRIHLPGLYVFINLLVYEKRKLEKQKNLIRFIRF